MSSPGAPTWLVALLVVLSVAAAVTFSLFVYRHAQQAALRNQYVTLKEIELPALRTRQGAVTSLVPELDKAIALRRERAQALEEVEKTWTSDLDRLVQDNKNRLGEIGEANRKEVRAYADLMREAPERRAEVSREEERSYAQEHDADENRRKLRDEIEQVAQTLEKEKKQARTEILGLDARIAELEERVRFLTNQFDIESREMRPDGRLIAASAASSGFVVIDKGQKQNLRRGTRFTVFTQRGGKNVAKGQIEVVKVEDRISTCRVLVEKDRNDPFIDGDQIHNPVWDPDRVKSFAIRGDFRSFSKGELERFIQEGGGRIDIDLKNGTDYLVAGANADRWTALAVKLGVAILSEEQLLDFIRPQE